MQQGVRFLFQREEPAGCQLDVSPPKVRPVGSCSAFVPLRACRGMLGSVGMGIPSIHPSLTRVRCRASSEGMLQAGRGEGRVRAALGGREPAGSKGDNCSRELQQRLCLVETTSSIGFQLHVAEKKTSLTSEIQPGQSAPYRALNWLRERQQLARSFCFTSLLSFFFFLGNQL